MQPPTDDEFNKPDRLPGESRSAYKQRCKKAEAEFKQKRRRLRQESGHQTTEQLLAKAARADVKACDREAEEIAMRMGESRAEAFNTWEIFQDTVKKLKRELIPEFAEKLGYTKCAVAGCGDYGLCAIELDKKEVKLCFNDYLLGELLVAVSEVEKLNNKRNKKYMSPWFSNLQRLHKWLAASKHETQSNNEVAVLHQNYIKQFDKEDSKFCSHCRKQQSAWCLVQNVSKCQNCFVATFYWPEQNPQLPHHLVPEPDPIRDSAPSASEAGPSEKSIAKIPKIRTHHLHLRDIQKRRMITMGYN
ncbi:hypothetical protein T439DRAFT_330330 [Meredithblackwellia eburnea MCA 4105]